MQSNSQTIAEHIKELRKRLFVVALFGCLGGLAAYVFREQLAILVIKPLKQGQLIYTTPGGGFQFVVNLCIMSALIIALPVFLYQTLRFIEPTFEKPLKKKVLLFSLISTVLASLGILFAYLVSLPAALNFLGSFTEKNLTALITIDSYMRFVVTYMLGFAVIFQIPLIIMIIDWIKPVKPSRLLKALPMIILVSFIIGAILTPTPDPINQTLLAGPIVILYLMGVATVRVSTKRNKKTVEVARSEESVATSLPVASSQAIPMYQHSTQAAHTTPVSARTTRRVMNDMIYVPAKRPTMNTRKASNQNVIKYEERSPQPTLGRPIRRQLVGVM